MQLHWIDGTMKEIIKTLNNVKLNISICCHIVQDRKRGEGKEFMSTRCDALVIKTVMIFPGYFTFCYQKKNQLPEKDTKEKIDLK